MKNKKISQRLDATDNLICDLIDSVSELKENQNGLIMVIKRTTDHSITINKTQIDNNSINDNIMRIFNVIDKMQNDNAILFGTLLSKLNEIK